MSRSASDTLHLAIGLLGTSRPFTVLHRFLYRRFRGRGILHHGLGADAILLTTRGRRTGEPRTVPLFAFRVDEAPDGPSASDTEIAPDVPAAPDAPAAPGPPASPAPGTWAVVASYAGRHHAPAWYLNLEADPAVEVQLADRRWKASARTATEGERAALWPRVVTTYAGYDVYRRRTHRPIPIVLLEDA